MGPNGATTGVRGQRAVGFLFLLRYPLLLAAGLVALGVWGPGSSLLGSLFAVRSWDLAVLTFFGFLGGWVLVLNLHVLVYWAPERFGIGPDDLPRWLAGLGRWLGRLRWWIAPLLAAPLLFSAILTSRLGWKESLPMLAVGGACATLVLWVLSGLAQEPQQRVRFLPNVAPVRWIHAAVAPIKRLSHGLPVPAMIGRRLGAGYVDRQGDILPGHVFLTVFFALALVGYGVLGFLLRPDGPYPEAVPALGYALVLWSLAVWVLSAASFLCDGLRIPPLLALLTLSYLLYSAGATDHYYEVWRQSTPIAEERTERASAKHLAFAPTFGPLSPRMARTAWAARRPPAYRNEILVATSGGGITAATWTALVLTELEKRHGEDLTRQLALISAVSGGSVGALFYLYDFERGGRPDDALEAIRCRVSRSSLRQVAWGLAYPDAWRLLLAPLAGLFPLRDRGWALEVAWQRMLARERRPGPAGSCEWQGDGGATDRLAVDAFSDWRASIQRGELPVPIFNATVSDTGEMLFLSPVDLEQASSEPGFQDVLTLRRLYPEADLAVTTAARLSATFPYVTPISRSNLEPCSSASPAARATGGDDAELGCVPYADYHVADGGYYDNFGVASLAAWVRASQEREAQPPRLLVIEIRAFGSSPPRPPSPSIRPREVRVGDRGWMWAFLGPLSTMIQARTRSQLVRNESHLELLADHYEKLGSCIVRAPFELAADLSLSWQLGPGEREQIRDALNENEASFAKVQGFLESTGCPGNREAGGPLGRSTIVR